MIAVVHLVWGPLGAAPLRAFLDSYHRHPAGGEHELICLFNGVEEQAAPALIETLGGTPHRRLVLPQPTQDLTAYRWAAEQLEHPRICFLNSYSVILAPDWLAKLDGALSGDAGLVGATGSWASFHSSVRNSLGLPNPYRGVAQPSRAQTRRLWCEIEEELAAGGEQDAGGSAPETPLGRRRLTANRLKSLRQLPEHLLHFESFPAHHLRTNAFMAERSHLLALRTSAVGRKMHALRLESGRSSYTRQTQRAGRRVLVVDRDGETFEQDRWAASATFWQRDQEGLLVADNRTAVYANGGMDRRRLLAARAWGPEADPSPPVRRDAPSGVGA